MEAMQMNAMSFIANEFIECVANAIACIANVLQCMQMRAMRMNAMHADRNACRQ